MEKGDILDHECMDMVDDIGSEVKNLRKGDQKKKTPHEEIFLSFSGMLGYSHVTQYVRLPFAETNTLKIPANLSDEKVLFLSDIFPTG